MENGSLQYLSFFSCNPSNLPLNHDYGRQVLLPQVAQDPGSSRKEVEAYHGAEQRTIGVWGACGAFLFRLKLSHQRPPRLGAVDPKISQVVFPMRILQGKKPGKVRFTTTVEIE